MRFHEWSRRYEIKGDYGEKANQIQDPGTPFLLFVREMSKTSAKMISDNKGLALSLEEITWSIENHVQLW